MTKSNQIATRCGLGAWIGGLLVILISLVAGYGGETNGLAVIKWSASQVLLAPGAGGAFDDVSVKDPSIVQVDGQWHVFYTAINTNKDVSLGYVSSPTLESLANAPRTQLRYEGYAAAPQVFYFAPQEAWYLIFQTRSSNYQPVFATTKTLAQPTSWSPPQPLVVKSEKTKWIDFWVICDEAKAYLFYTRQPSDEVWVMSTSLQQFPKGFGNARRAFSPVHEAAHIYQAKGRNEYHMIYESNRQGLRSFGLAVSPTLEGPWRVSQPEWASGVGLSFAPAIPRWTDMVSHGEFIRTGYDQHCEYDPGRPQLFIQGRLQSETVPDYLKLPWRLGLIRSK